MKKFAFNTFAICIAFVTGLAINNACADPVENMTDSELRRLVVQLQSEIENLKNEISLLKDKIYNNSSQEPSSCGEFQVDGLYFDRNGFCTSIINQIEYQYESLNQKNALTYERDKYGRVSKATSTTTLEDGTTNINVDYYSYNGKNLIITNKTNNSTITYKYQ